MNLPLYFNEILSLSDFSFGKNYMTSKELESYWKDPNSEVIIESEEDKLKGFSIVQVLDLKQLKNVLFVDSSWVEKEFEELETIGYRKMTAVNKAYEGQGVASRLFQAGFDWFSDKTNVITSAVWAKKGEITFEPILKKNGFETVKFIENYWKEDSLKRRFNCPICGEPPCECSAVIYRKILSLSHAE